MNREKLQQVRVVLSDIDGVMTDARLVYGPEGEEHKVFNAKDGHMIKVARKRGYRFGVVSGRKLAASQRRCEELGCQPIFLGVTDKVSVVRNWLETCRLDWSQVAFLGDDEPDLPCMQLSAVSVCPSDAHPELLKRADVITTLPGGRGAVAEFLRLLVGHGAFAKQTNDGHLLHG